MHGKLLFFTRKTFRRCLTFDTMSSYVKTALSQENKTSVRFAYKASRFVFGLIGKYEDMFSDIRAHISFLCKLATFFCVSLLDQVLE